MEATNPISQAAVELARIAIESPTVEAAHRALGPAVLAIPADYRAEALFAALVATGQALRVAIAQPATEPEPPPPGLAQSRCKSCHAPIYWLPHVATGKMAPIDAVPAPAGNIFIHNGKYSLLPPSEPGPRYTNHFQTCPDAPRYAPQKAGG